MSSRQPAQARGQNMRYLARGVLDSDAPGERTILDAVPAPKGTKAVQLTDGNHDGGSSSHQEGLKGLSNEPILRYCDNFTSLLYMQITKPEEACHANSLQLQSLKKLTRTSPAWTWLSVISGPFSSSSRRPFTTKTTTWNRRNCKNTVKVRSGSYIATLTVCWRKLVPSQDLTTTPSTTS